MLASGQPSGAVGLPQPQQFASDDTMPTFRTDDDHVSGEHFDRTLALVLDRLEQVREHQLSGEQMAAAVAAGMRQAVADPDVWREAGAAMRREAQTTAGGWLLGGLSGVASKVWWALLALVAIYALGGWSALVAAVKSGAAK